MAELADALGSGLSERKLVRVQVPPSAPQGTASSGETHSLKGEFCFVDVVKIIHDEEPSPCPYHPRRGLPGVEGQTVKTNSHQQRGEVVFEFKLATWVSRSQFLLCSTDVPANPKNNRSSHRCDGPNGSKDSEIWGQAGGIIREIQAFASLVKTRSHRNSSFVSF